VRFERSLGAEDGDRESRLLAAARSEFPFAVRCAVPGREPAVVHGSLFYFPCEGDRETLPEFSPYGGAAAAAGPAPGGGAVARIFSQPPPQSQAPLLQSQAPIPQSQAPPPGGAGGAGAADAAAAEAEDRPSGTALVARTPSGLPADMFETFWQARATTC
jgi:hypothetical protein